MILFCRIMTVFNGNRRAAAALFIMLAIFPSAVLLYAAENRQSITPFLYQSLQERGFVLKKQLLAGPESSLFPYNIILDIPAAGNAVQPDTIITAISQEDAAGILDRICGYAQSLQAMRLPVNCRIVLTALDYPVLPAEYGGRTAHGTEEFLNQVENGETLCAILPIPSSRLDGHIEKITIVPGAGSVTAPPWLLKQMPIPDIRSFLIFYRQGAIASDEKLARFLQDGIPSIGIQYDPESPAQLDALFDSLISFAENYRHEDDTQWDRHYDFLPSGPFNILIIEKTFVNLFIIIITVSLFVLCGFSFLIGAGRYQNRKDFFRTLYLVPATVLITALILEASQTAVTVLMPQIHNLFLIFVFKIIASLLIVSLFFILLIRLHLPISQFVYGILMTLMAITNIFIFSARDVTFVFLFMIEYLIVFTAGNARRLGSLIAAEIILILPFIPYIHNLIQYADYETLKGYVVSDFMGNMLLACILIPVLIMWLKIQIRILIFLKGKNIPFAFLIPIVTGIISLVAAGLILFVSLSGITDTRVLQANTHPTVTDTSETNYTEITTTDNYFLELRTITLHMASSLPLIRTDITVRSAYGTPIYDAEYPYETAKNAVLFQLPEYPPEPFSLAYTTNNADGMTIQADIYLLSDMGQVLKESKTIAIQNPDT